MVSTLVRKGSNSIWEHALHDSSKVKIKKPSPRDKIQYVSYPAVKEILIH